MHAGIPAMDASVAPFHSRNHRPDGISRIELRPKFAHRSGLRQEQGDPLTAGAHHVTAIWHGSAFMQRIDAIISSLNSR
jgi:hypothetical protein